MTNYGTITPRELYNIAKERGVADIPIYICAICEAGSSGIASEIINVEKEEMLKAVQQGLVEDILLYSRRGYKND